MTISHAYLDTLGVASYQGRGFEDREYAGPAWEVIVNRAFIDEFFDGRNPVGQLIGVELGIPDLDAVIVGVVADARHWGLHADPYPQVYVDYRQAAASGVVETGRAFFAVRTSNPDALIANLRLIVDEFDSNARIEAILPLGQIVADPAVRDGWVLAWIGLRWHFQAEGGDSHARERRGRGCSALLAASIGRHRPGFSLPQRVRR